MVFGGILIGILLDELGLRLLGIGEQGLYQWDADRGWRLCPRASEWQRREGNAFVQINREGMRDREHSYRKAVDTMRIAFIGDSFTEAEQVALKDDFVSVVEERTRTCPRLRGKSVETLNFGCDSYGTAQEFITLQRSVWSIRPTSSSCCSSPEMTSATIRWIWNGISASRFTCFMATSSY